MKEWMLYLDTGKIICIKAETWIKPEGVGWIHFKVKDQSVALFDFSHVLGFAETSALGE